MLVDGLIIVLVILAVIRNWQSGFLRQFWPTLGFLAGLTLGHYLDQYALKLVHTPASRSIMTITTMLGLAMIGLSIGEYIGFRLKHHWQSSRFNAVDNAAGSLLTIASVLIGAWLIASIILALPANQLQSDIKDSKIISLLNRNLPSVPKLLTDVGQLIDPNGFPDVFSGSEPIPRGNVNLPSLGDLSGVVNADRYSVVRIQGIGCGGLVSGSGFVVGQGLVATNAHVVAGINQPYVQDVNGNHIAQVIYFDPDLDFAVLKTNDLAGAPLSISSAKEPTGAPGAVLGYPGGGGFEADPAAIIDEFEASGHNIYGSGNTLRDVYEIQADIIPGNSGGPLIDTSGKVIGVVFAASTTYNHVGYTLTTAKVMGEIKQASANQSPVNSSRCAE